MKNQTYRTSLWQTLLVTTLVVTLDLNTVFASNPFHAADFVKVPGFGSLEIQKSEMTYAQLGLIFPGFTPWKDKECYHKGQIEKGFGPNYPAVCLSYIDADFITMALNTKDPNYEYSLLKDEEMQKLVAMTLDALRINGNISDESLSNAAWFLPNSDEHAHEVCKKKQILGLCDILGNVWEWTTWRCAGNSCNYRGGGWDSDAFWLLSNRYDYYLQGGRLGFVGIRLVRTPK